MFCDAAKPAANLTEPTSTLPCSRHHLPVMLAESQLHAFSAARRLAMFSEVIKTWREVNWDESWTYNKPVNCVIHLLDTCSYWSWHYHRCGLISEQYTYGFRTLVIAVPTDRFYKVFKACWLWMNRLLEGVQVPSGFGQGLQTSVTQLSTDGVVQLGRIWVRRLQSISEHLLSLVYQLLHQRSSAQNTTKKDLRKTGEPRGVHHIHHLKLLRPPQELRKVLSLHTLWRFASHSPDSGVLAACSWHIICAEHFSCVLSKNYYLFCQKICSGNGNIQAEDFLEVLLLSFPVKYEMSWNLFLFLPLQEDSHFSQFLQSTGMQQA